MNYKKISIACDDSVSDILIALLADRDYEAFEQEKGLLYCYIPEDLFLEDELREITETFGVKPEIESIEKTNWNKKWEENFPPVIVENFCTIRADFHDLHVNTPYEIIIHPKMSFGTGHHATTQLMMEAMSIMTFKNKTVLDFGTGTGILGILASYLGAADVIGIDNEDWSCENAKENAIRNHVNNFSIKEGSLELVKGQRFEIILANINRHILLHYLDDLHLSLEIGGQLLMSGILLEDKEIMLTESAKSGFELVNDNSRNNWLQLTFTKR